ncbi:unnamed protein product [Ixodes pacificus]
MAALIRRGCKAPIFTSLAHIRSTMTGRATATTPLKPQLYMDATGQTWFSAAVDELDSLQDYFKSDNNEDHQYLDLGCGTGDITRDGLLPRCLPCRKIVAVDVSKYMVDYARMNFPHPKITYDVLDIVWDDVPEFVKRYGQFERVCSLFCFNWVKDQEKAFKNVANVMKPGGKGFFRFYAASPHMRFRRKLATMDRWKKYAEICEGCIPPSVALVGKEALLSHMSGLLKAANLTPVICEVRRETPTYYTGLEHLIQELMNMNPMRNYLTKQEEALLFEDVTMEATRLWTEREAGSPSLDLDVFVVLAIKPGL